MPIPSSTHALALLPPSAVERIEAIWRYVALGGSSIVTEELAPVLGGIAAQQHRLGLVGVMAACAVGSWAGMFAFYLLGRWRGRWAANRWPRFGAQLGRVLGPVSRRPWRSSIATRFAIGARWVLPAACGAAHVPLGLYLAGSLVSSLLWAPPLALLGWAFGETAVAFVDRFKEYGAALTALLAVAIVALVLVRRRARNAQRSA